jgi:hypothetical protein
MIVLSLIVRKTQGGWTVICGEWVSPPMDRESALRTAEDMATVVRLVGDTADVVVED